MMIGEKLRSTMQLLSNLEQQLAGAAALMSSFADSLQDPAQMPEEMKLAIREHGEELAARMEKLAGALALAWQQSKRTSNAVWAHTAPAKPACEGGNDVV